MVRARKLAEESDAKWTTSDICLRRLAVACCLQSRSLAEAASVQLHWSAQSTAVRSRLCLCNGHSFKHIHFWLCGAAAEIETLLARASEIQIDCSALAGYPKYDDVGHIRPDQNQNNDN